jgi:hypothetical protein
MLVLRCWLAWDAQAWRGEFQADWRDAPGGGLGLLPSMEAAGRQAVGSVLNLLAYTR